MLAARLLLALALACLLTRAAAAAETVRVAAQKTGTLAWELDVIRAHGLDKETGIVIDAIALASPEAGKIALRGDTVDVIVSDWLWTTRERSLGGTLVFYPYSSTLGAVMVRQDSPIRSLADLSGRTLAVAGGPLDKSWLLLQALARREGRDLARAATIAYGAPALLAEKTARGEMDANLNYWNHCAALEAKGFRRLIAIEDVIAQLGAKGRPAMLGYVFDSRWAARNRAAITGFLTATRRAKEILATSDAEWDRIAPLVAAPDAETLAAIRTRYREGIPRRPIAEEETDARLIYRVLAEVGGTELVGNAPELDPGTFYHPPQD